MTATAPLPEAGRRPVGRPAAGSDEVVWRSSRNPIVTRDPVPRANSIFNSAVVAFGDGFAGVFRVDDTRRVMNIHAGRSADGVEWELDRSPIAFVPADARVRRSRRSSSTRTTRASPGSTTGTT